MMAIVPLLAGIDAELIKGLVFLFIIVLSALAQWLNKANQKKGLGRPAAPPQPPKPRLDDPVVNEVEEFLRRAAQGRQPEAKKAERQGGRAARPTMAEPMPSRSPGKVVRGKSVEVVREKRLGKPLPSPQPLGEEVGQHVKKYLNEDAFERRSTQLGAEVAQVDSDINQHLHQTFDHALGQLAGVPGEAAVAPTAIDPIELAAVFSDASATSPAGLFLLLSNPDSIRQAIVLNEVLRRPEERWE